MRVWSVLAAAGLALGSAVQAAQSPLVVGYYAGWLKNQTAGVDLQKYTHINVAFGVPDSSGHIGFPDKFSLQQAVAEIHGAKAKALLSLGGWTGSSQMSTIVKSQIASSALIAEIVNHMASNGFDGIDIDWEYPGRPGNTCNVVDAVNDTPNLLRFLQQLRTTLDTRFGSGNKLITMAVSTTPFAVNGTPLTDVSPFAKVTDFINVMIYDINGIWMDQTGPNAPLYYEDGKGTAASFATAIKAWTKAGWPAGKLNAGLPFYGRSVTTAGNMLDDRDNQYQALTKVLPKGDSEDTVTTDTCANTTGVSGIWMYRHLRDEGVLSGPTTAAKPWVRSWDEITHTPWLFNPTTKQYITYDDVDSIKSKVEYAASMGVAGVMVWSLYMDYQSELLNVIHTWGTSTKGIADGAQCPSDGLVSCRDYDGVTSTYFICDQGKWQQFSCHPTTVCFSYNARSLYCGWREN
ncbi:hypothetical protein IWQ57_004570 [Coemansia nantahalensis]|uniref:Uncharacterized protein n=1 Tax=Coemansia nantahalensis TaxID=2789366 RepID=A0ACC1JRQ7_9FUNG|nr:hypothetical protein IWQ57_004570 [Coemansia nantahalensis]